MDEEKWKEGAIRGRQEKKKNKNQKHQNPEQNAQNPRKTPKTDDPQTENPIKTQPKSKSKRIIKISAKM